MTFIVKTKFAGYSPDGIRTYQKGGGGGGKTPRELRQLYSEQAASARLLRQQAEQNLPGAVTRYMDSVNQITGPGYAERQAGMASADMASANAMERAATERNLASMGVNPNDARFAGSMRELELGNAARLAAGKNLARNDAERFQLAAAQDAVGTFTGQSNSAATQMAGAASGLANLANQRNAMKQQESAQTSANVANGVGGAMTAWSMFKDGGEVPKARPLEAHMLGGTAGQAATQSGFFPLHQVAPPPEPVAAPAQPQGPSLMQVAMLAKKTKDTTAAGKAAANTDKLGRLVGKFSESGGNQIQSHAAGMRMVGNPDQAAAARDAYAAASKSTSDPALQKAYADASANIADGAGIGAKSGTEFAGANAAAAEQSGAGLVAGKVAGTGLSTLASEGAATGTGLGLAEATGGALANTATDTLVGNALSGSITGAAGSTAASAAGSTALGAAMGAIGTAMPWVGAAYAVGSLLGAWANGGEIPSATDAVDGRDGTEVEGPGGHTDDIVPAVLSAKEGVLNGEAMALGGREIMKELNEEGLELRKQGVPLSKIKKQYGLAELTK